MGLCLKYVNNKLKKTVQLFVKTNPKTGTVPNYKYQTTMVLIQVWIAQLVAHWLGITEVVGSNPGKEEDFSK